MSEVSKELNSKYFLRICNSKLISLLATDSLGNAPQKKVFYTKGRYWIFYLDGTTLKWISSTDLSTWTSPYTLTDVSVDDSCDIAFTFDGVRFHYIRVEDGSPNFYHRRGIPQNDGSIIWEKEEVLKTNDPVSSYCNMCKDAFGNDWFGILLNDYPAVQLGGKSPSVLGGDTGGYECVLMVKLSNGKIGVVYPISSSNYKFGVRIFDGSSWSDQIEASYELDWSEWAYLLKDLNSDDFYLIYGVFVSHTESKIVVEKFNSTSKTLQIISEFTVEGDVDPVVGFFEGDHIRLIWILDSSNIVYSRKVFLDGSLSPMEQLSIEGANISTIDIQLLEDPEPILFYVLENGELRYLLLTPKYRVTNFLSFSYQSLAYLVSKVLTLVYGLGGYLKKLLESKYLTSLRTVSLVIKSWNWSFEKYYLKEFTAPLPDAYGPSIRDMFLDSVTNFIYLCGWWSKTYFYGVVGKMSKTGDFKKIYRFYLGSYPSKGENILECLLRRGEFLYAGAWTRNEPLIIKFNDSLNVIFCKKVACTTSTLTEGTYMDSVLLPDGNLIIVSTCKFDGVSKLMVLKLDTSDSLCIYKIFRPKVNTTLREVSYPYIATDGEYIYISFEDMTDDYAYVAKLDLNLNPLWCKRVEPPPIDFYIFSEGITVDEDRIYFLSPHYYGASIFFFKKDGSLEKQWWWNWNDVAYYYGLSKVDNYLICSGFLYQSPFPPYSNSYANQITKVNLQSADITLFILDRYELEGETKTIVNDSDIYLAGWTQDTYLLFGKIDWEGKCLENCPYAHIVTIDPKVYYPTPTSVTLEEEFETLSLEDQDYWLENLESDVKHFRDYCIIKSYWIHVRKLFGVLRKGFKILRRSFY